MPVDLTRRAALGLVATGSVLTVSRTRSFTQLVAGRGADVSTADDPDAIVGLLVADSVKRNDRETLVDIQNRTDGTVEFTVSLEDCTQGTLYGPNGSGCSVGVSLADGVSKSVRIEAAVKDTTVPFTVTGTAPGFGFEATRETTAVSGNAPGAIQFKKLEGFGANADGDVWTIKNVDVRDGDGDADLDRVEFEVADGGGTVRATRTETCGCNGGSRYSPGGNPSVALSPDDAGYDVTGGETYKLTVRAFDADGNSAFETRETTA